AKHIKSSLRVQCKEDKFDKTHGPTSLPKDETCQKILDKLRGKLDVDVMELLEELFIEEGIFNDFNSDEEVESAFKDVTSRTISSLQQAVEELLVTVEELEGENKALKARVEAAERYDAHWKEARENPSFLHRILGINGFISWFGSFFHI
ncbi:unnamed protein product, partial [Ilex paraguariensis]